MSRDLLAAFEDDVPKTSYDTLQAVAQADYSVDQEDDFGDFEDASAAAAPSAEHPTQSSAGEATRPLAKDAKTSELRKTVASTVARPTASELDKKQHTVGHHPFAGRMNLLFEAGDDEYDAGHDELADLASNPEAAVAYSKRIIAEQQGAQASAKRGKSWASARSITESNSKTASGSKKLRKKSEHVPAKDPNVLFDADDVSEDSETSDAFGDFDDEAVSARVGSKAKVPHPVQLQSSMPALDLLGMDEPISSPPISHTETGVAQNGRLGSRAGSAFAKRAVTAISPAGEDDNVWDDFEAPLSEGESAQISDVAPTLDHSQRPSQSAKASTKNAEMQAPTNVPPPVVLLSIFPPVFAAADDALFKTMAKLGLKQRQMLLAHPASHQFLLGYLGHCHVLARIIAGRRLRWKRDKHLSQSMRIGPAAAGGKGGMKLTGIDKSELAKEDREVVDTVGLWRAQAGKLRTAVTAVSAAPGNAKLPPVPEIAEQIPVKTLKAIEGGVAAPHACALCGLKRDERVVKVDSDVNDSFGEWWDQSTNMHVACKRFWVEFEKKLKSR